MNPQLEPLPPAVKARGRSKWRKRLTMASLVVLSLVLIVAGYMYLSTQAGNRQLAEAVAEADRLDPGWRLEEVEAQRRAVPPEANSALKVPAVTTVLPNSWQDQQLDTSLQGLEPSMQLDAEQTARLTAELGKVQPALAEARKLAGLPYGRRPITYSADWISTSFMPTIQTRDVANLLAHDALLKAQQGDIDGALLSCRAILNVGRSIGDEPFLISMLVRIAIRSIAIYKTERVLAQGEPSAGVLADFQKLLEEEEAEPLLLFATRGERAGSQILIQQFKEGKVTMSQITGGPVPSKYKLGPIDLERLLTPLFIGSLSGNQASLLRYMTRAVEIAKKPIEEQTELLKDLETTAPSQPVLVRLMAPTVSKVGEAGRRTAAQTRCMIVLLAAERYRLAHGRWPESLEALVPEFLPKVPTDPYDRKPLRLRRLDDGLVVYSVGPDGKDDGGNLNRQNLLAPGSDLGFRLWDVVRRHQPPLNPEVGPPRPAPEEP
jgi:hypothetical protein